MIRNAEQFAEEDKKRRDKAEKLNNADAICYQAERTLADFGAKIAAELKARIEAALKETREAVTAKDPGHAAAKAEALKTVMQEVGKAIYAQAPEAEAQSRPRGAEAAGPEAQPAGAPTGGRVVDAEYREAGRR